MDIASVSTHMLFTSLHASISHKDFGVNVGKALVNPHLRYEAKKLKNNLERNHTEY